MNRIAIVVRMEGWTTRTTSRKPWIACARSSWRTNTSFRDPRSLTTFEDFGGNALTLVLRCYLDSPEYRPAVTSQLHQSIHEMFHAAGIATTSGAQKGEIRKA